MEKDYKISAKRNNKWWNYGKIYKNKFGNMELSIRVTPELKELVNSKEWLNFSLFEDNNISKTSNNPSIDMSSKNDDIPF